MSPDTDADLWHARFLQSATTREITLSSPLVMAAEFCCGC
jgi:hypothetical protein